MGLGHFEFDGERHLFVPARRGQRFQIEKIKRCRLLYGMPAFTLLEYPCECTNVYTHKYYRANLHMFTCVWYEYANYIRER